MVPQPPQRLLQGEPLSQEELIRKKNTIIDNPWSGMTEPK